MTTPDNIISQIDVPNVPLTSDKIDLTGIKAKYDNDPEKMADAIYNLNQQNTKLSQSISVPSEYKVFEDHKKYLDTDTMTKLINHARESKFTQEQFDSAINLINLLCEEYYIPKTVMSHNTKTDLVGYNGVVYKSNIQKHYTDLNPTWKFGEFKNKLEENN